MVEVFITNIQNKIQAERVLTNLRIDYPKFELHCDLNETEFPFLCGHTVLRVEGDYISAKQLMESVLIQGFKCEILEDKVCT